MLNIRIKEGFFREPVKGAHNTAVVGGWIHFCSVQNYYNSISQENQVWYTSS